MYSDKRRHLLIPVLLVFLLLTGVFSALRLSYGKERSKEDGVTSLRETILRFSLQCYAVEGVYPPDLDYLIDNYGLVVNRKDYVISYEIFADNLPPEVRVVKRDR